jgi:ABC-type multidrug transport system fused ATPase/permease subunit
VFDFHAPILSDTAAGSLGTPCGCVISNADLCPNGCYVVAVLQARVVLFLGVFSGTVTVGTIVMFLQYSRQIQGPMTQAGQLLNNFERVKASAKRVFVLFDYPVSVPEASDATVLKDV